LSQVAPQRRNHRISKAVEADRAALRSLQDLSDYRPNNPAYSIESLKILESILAEAEQAEVRARAALEAAREQVAIAARALHDAVQGAKAQVLAQYGSDSLALQAVGLRRRSERKRPARRPSKGE
jgi:hypothetical protein